jgi:hypothetical protein
MQAACVVECLQRPMHFSIYIQLNFRYQIFSLASLFCSFQFDSLLSCMLYVVYFLRTWHGIKLGRHADDEVSYHFFSSFILYILSLHHRIIIIIIVVVFAVHRISRCDVVVFCLQKFIIKQSQNNRCSFIFYLSYSSCNSQTKT